MLWTDLRELKAVLQIDPQNTAEDALLNFFSEWAGDWFGELLNRPDFSLNYRTEFKKGTGTRKLLLGYRPVQYTPRFPIVVLQDFGGNFGSTSGSFQPGLTTLTYGGDFCLQVDQPDLTTSRCGILLRINALWYRPVARAAGLLSPFVTDDLGSYKVTYYGGYTVDTLPARLRMAANLLCARLRYLFPLGVELGSESYEDRNISSVAERDDYVLSVVKPMILSMRNHKF